MNRSHMWLIAAGALVLALTNAVVLVGVASNRQQPPDSVLILSERELGPEWNWMWREGEDSGLSLRLQYRVESAWRPKLAELGAEEVFGRFGNFGPIVWLDRDKLAALGFDVATPPTFTGRDIHYDRMLGRDVLLVLELDGPVRARALQAARELLTRRQLELAANPEHKDAAQRLEIAQNALQSEEDQASRLFVVDAGLDQTILRQRYADRTHYAIVHGNIRPFVTRDGASAKVYGAVTAVRCATINIPLQFRAAVPLDPPTNIGVMATARVAKNHPFTINVAFGSRLEPWIVSAHNGPTSTAQPPASSRPTP
jgi:Domain of unknown function (DUF4824)